MLLILTLIKYGFSLLVPENIKVGHHLLTVSLNVSLYTLRVDCIDPIDPHII